ncbi:MAG: hydroxyethylthiazole kinase [Eubacterium sp.]|nr:hydroxyethylthiazole kinase [Eubacterium sp.]
MLETGKLLRSQNPLIHCITSPIAVNDCANAVLAVGARPIMAEHPREVAGITAISQALGVSLANITDARAESIMISGRQALQDGLPSAIDVVGVNCSAFRMDLAKQFIRDCRPAVIKGNASEIRAIAGAAYGEAGIDTAVSDRVSHDNPGSVEAAADVVRNFAKATGAVVLASGIIDVISDGEAVWLVENGSPLLARVTGTGCILNCLIASYLSVCKRETGDGSVSPEAVKSHFPDCASALQAVCYATTLLGAAGEIAEAKLPQPGALGSYHVALMDALALTGREEIRKFARIRQFLPALR